jgi:hypothetical protein
MHRSSFARRHQAGNRIVVGERDDREASARRETNDLRGRLGAVGGRRVKMKIGEVQRR